MHLTAEEKSILDGKQGEAARIALSVLVDLGQLFGARELMTVPQVHIDATLYMVDAGLEFAEKMANLTDAGVMAFTDGCPLQYPKETWHFNAAMTDSAKFANYCFSQSGFEAAYASIEDCVETAVQGKICRRESPWRKK